MENIEMEIFLCYITTRYDFWVEQLLLELAFETELLEFY